MVIEVVQPKPYAHLCLDSVLAIPLLLEGMGSTQWIVVLECVIGIGLKVPLDQIASQCANVAFV